MPEELTVEAITEAVTMPEDAITEEVTMPEDAIEEVTMPEDAITEEVTAPEAETAPEEGVEELEGFGELVAENLPFSDLSVDIFSVDLPESATELFAPGSVEIAVTNEGDADVSGTIDLNLYVSSDKMINSRVLPLTGEEVKDGLLGTLENAELESIEPGETQFYTLDYENITSFVPPGSQFLIAEIDPDSVGALEDQDIENNTSEEIVSLPGTDVVIDWMTTGMNLTSNQFLFDEFPLIGAGPPEGTRAGALLSASIFNAFAGVTGEFDPYAIDLDAIEMSPEGVSVEAAIVGAAYTVLEELYPEQREILVKQMELSIEEIEDDSIAEITGLAYGEEVAKELLDMRADELETDDPDNYEFLPIDPDDPFFWTPDDNGTGLSVGAQYGDDAEPYAIESSDAILELASPDALDSPEFLADLQTVAAFGGFADTDETTILRTDDQSEIAKFYFVDRGDSYKPNKHLNHIAAELSIEQGFDLKENVELFFKLNLALADAVIVAWDGKFTEQYPRPSQPIIDDLGIDPDWAPFLEDPPFPDWISGHGTMAFAAEVIFEDVFGDIGDFSVVSPDTPGIERTVGSFDELADEFAFSRVFAGVHTIDGSVLDPDTFGTAVGEAVLEVAEPLIAEPEAVV